MAMPYLTLTLSVFVCLGAFSDVSSATVNLNLRNGEMGLQTRDEKLIAHLMNDLAKNVQQLKPRMVSRALLMDFKDRGVVETGGMRLLMERRVNAADAGARLHQTLLNLPPPAM
ncbi:hypothetical protein KS4_17750 [Poriferisphaera corsica]|uniref:Uncharacterized protein n=1 Tax=Poriferisphaera corsica TaxID=2528020 RepID=A0A517YU52_9BACT|nr:hypothetical protein [Poriferisphaera corsica]QDU33719.1 hypothetical protein KS4_17750 [Poriferisphaera corsica]